MANATTTPLSTLQALSGQLPSLGEGEYFLRAVENSASGRWGTWKSHVNMAIMAGARPEVSESSFVAEHCFDTFVDQLWAVLLEEGLLPVEQAFQRFSDLELDSSASRRVAREALARTVQAYAPLAEGVHAA